jgi:histidinol dehydrogenase
MVRRLVYGTPEFKNDFYRVLYSKREMDSDVSETVAKILNDVFRDRNKAVEEYTRKFDRHKLPLRITAEEIEKAVGECDQETLAALDVAAKRIRAFHEKQKPVDISYTDEIGVRLGLRWLPVKRAGLYVPGGTASYPSSVLMNALPAKVAGVERLIMTVPTPDGKLNPLVLAAAKLAGVDEVWRIGGAQAIGALAYGMDGFLPVDKIVGPGNAYVAAAKRQVSGMVGIDMIAGPSEILVVADKDNDPAWIAADLLSQAEHDESAQSILITDDAAFGDAVAEAVESQLKTLNREKIARQSWEDHGTIIVVPSLDVVPKLIDSIAPEHLELAVADPDALAAKVHNAGAIFLGRYTPEAIGDYLGGPNHVLPTARSARFSSGLGVLDFMKRTTLLGCSAESLRELGPSALALAKSEGLEAHGLSVSIRLNLPREGR